MDWEKWRSGILVALSEIQENTILVLQYFKTNEDIKCKEYHSDIFIAFNGINLVKLP